MPTVLPPANSEISKPSPKPDWDDALLANPHAVADKRRRVQNMFAAIAPSYDLNNRLHSVWMDQAWRRKAVKLAELKATDRVVDVACGTGDLTLAMYEDLMWRGLRSPMKHPDAAQVIGIDFTYPMLPIAKNKATKVGFAKYAGSQAISQGFQAERAKRVVFLNGDAQSLPLPDACCDVVSIAFGIRNVQSPAAAFAEFYRALRPGGRLVVLEFSLPTLAPLRALYNLYFRHVLPRTATLISGDTTGAYKYLPQSVNTFIGRDEMLRLMERAGFSSLKHVPMTFGVCVCYVGLK